MKQVKSGSIDLRIILSRWAPFFIWVFIIYLFSAKPTGTVSEIDWRDFIVKKLAHVIEYGIFSVLFYRALKESGIAKGKAALISVVSAVAYGLSDEFHQSFTPGREPKIRDVFFDTLGATLSMYLVLNILPKMPEKVRNFAVKIQLL